MKTGELALITAVTGPFNNVSFNFFGSPEGIYATSDILQFLLLFKETHDLLISYPMYGYSLSNNIGYATENKKALET